MNKLKVSIQGYLGSFHDIAARKHFGVQVVDLIPADSFDMLADQLREGKSDLAIMAIENSIAGTIIQNYRILRENNFWIIGEIYLRIKHQLIGLPDANLEDIKEVSSHPMALLQCRAFLNQYPDWKLLESKDTALSASLLCKKNKKSKACIASKTAAELHGLKILSHDIETNKSNYTRFFVITQKTLPAEIDADKASIYIRIPDKKGQLLQVLKAIDKHQINLSKLQSYPVVGSFREYFFHIDVEFDHISQYVGMKEDLMQLTFEYEEIGIYKRVDITNILEKLQKHTI